MYLPPRQAPQGSEVGSSEASGPRQASPPMGRGQGSNSRQTSLCAPFLCLVDPAAHRCAEGTHSGSFLQMLGQPETPQPTPTPRSSPAPHPTPLGLSTSALHTRVLDAPGRLGHPGSVELCFLRARRPRVLPGCAAWAVPAAGFRHGAHSSFLLPVCLCCLPACSRGLPRTVLCTAPRPRPQQAACGAVQRLQVQNVSSSNQERGHECVLVPSSTGQGRPSTPAGLQPEAALPQACKYPCP